MRAIKLEWTGERYVTHMRGTIALEHLHRYAFACESVEGKDVLDIASGEGYGSEMLSRNAKHVYGVDIDQHSVVHAQNKYKLENLQFQVGSCTEIPLTDASVDIVVSFETIEHITDHDRMMCEVKRVLRPGGTLIISSPEKYGYSIETQNNNPFHLKELSKDEFKELIGKYFKYTEYLDQRVIYGSALIGVGGKAPLAKTYKFAGLPEIIESDLGLSQPMYSVAVCSDEKLNEINGSLCEQNVMDGEGALALIERVNALKAESNEVLIALEKKVKAVIELQQSLSWRITLPLRRTRDLLEVLLNRLKRLLN